MITLFAALLLAVETAAAPQGQAKISTYALRLDARPHGSADLTLNLRLDTGLNPSLRIPIPYAEVGDARLSIAPPSTHFAIASAGDRSTLVVTLPGSASTSVDLRFEGRVSSAVLDAGAAGRSVRLALMNAEPATIRDLSIVTSFPDGSRAHAIREALPKLGKSEAGPRAALESIDGRPGVRLHADTLVQGETASLKVDLAPAARSPGWLIAGLVLAALYLRSFRDLVGPPKK